MTDRRDRAALSIARDAIASELTQLTAMRDSARADLEALRAGIDAADSELLARIRDLSHETADLEGRLATLEDERVLTEERLALLDGGVVSRAQAIVQGASRRTPFVLLPVRIETRFAEGDQQDSLKLLVRIFPDDIHVQFDLSAIDEDEVAARDAYAATLVSGDQARAERDLLTAMTAYRAAWLVRSLGDDHPSVPEPVPRALAWATLLPTRWVVTVRGGGTDLASVVTTPVADEARSLALEPSADDDPLLPAWVTDFGAAVDAGMGVAIELNPSAAAHARGGGVDVIVIGVDHASAPEVGAARIAESLTGHMFGAGLRLVPQGSPTNNTALDRTDVGPASEHIFHDLVTRPGMDALPASDSARLERALGLEPATLASVARPIAGSALTGELDARAMATLLWPVAQGYAGEELTNVEAPYGHFTRFVRGRGPLPVIRVGDLPYGIVVAGPLGSVPAEDHGRQVLDRTPFVDAQPWRRALERTPSVPNGVTTPEELVELLRLTATSTAYRMRLLREATVRVDATSALISTGARVLLDKYSWLPSLQAAAAAFRWQGALVRSDDDLATSPGEYLNAIADSLAQLLIDDGDPPPSLPALAATSPALLFRLVKHGALFVAHWAGKISTELPERSPFLTALTEAFEIQPGQVAAMSSTALYTTLGQSTGLPPEFVQPILVRPGGAGGIDPRSGLDETAGADSETPAASITGAVAARLGLLPRSARSADSGSSATARLVPADPGGPAVHGGATAVPGDPTRSGLPTSAAFEKLLDARLKLDAVSSPAPVPPPVDTVEVGDFERVAEFVAAARHLAALEDRQLELLMAETLDTASYRRDAWVTSVHARHLELVRNRHPAGAHIGAYGFVLDLRPERAPLPAAGPSEHVDDPATSGGFLTAHSLDQAAALAVIRNAHLSHAADDDTADILRLNLDSRRVRLGKELADAVRNGNPPADVLGASFERLLHHRNQALLAESAAADSAGIDRYVVDFRLAFPQRPSDISSDETRDRVVNGVELVRAWLALRSDPETSGALFDLLTLAAADGHREELEHVLDQLNSQVDALNDLLLFEATYQAVRGDRSAATSVLDAHSGMAPPPEIAAVSTPAAGPSFTSRVLVLFPDESAAEWPGRANVRALLAPELNSWVETMLGDASRIRWGIRRGGSLILRSLADAQLSALDLVWSAEEWGRPHALGRPSESDELAGHLRAAASSEGSIDLVLAGDELAAALGTDEVALGDIGEFCVRLGRTIRAARPVTPADLVAAGEQPAGDRDVASVMTRVEAGVAVAEHAATDLEEAAAEPEPLTSGGALAAEQRQRLLGRVSAANLAGAGVDPIDPGLLEGRDRVDDYLQSLREGVTRLRRVATQATNSLVVEGAASNSEATRLRDAFTELAGSDFPLTVPFALPATDHAALHDAGAGLDVVTQSARRSWLQQVARVIPAVSEVELALMLARAVRGGTQPIGLAQLPWNPGDPWIGGELPADQVRARRHHVDRDPRPWGHQCWQSVRGLGHQHGRRSCAQRRSDRWSRVPVRPAVGPGTTDDRHRGRTGRRATDRR